MATGLPAIVTDIPSNREWVVSEENGWLAPTGAAEVFADRLVRAAHTGPGKRKAIAQKNRDIAETRADWHANFKSLLKAYDGIRSIQVC
jgi:glycosyltransferase involved in cell wall biosynthesis